MAQFRGPKKPVTKECVLIIDTVSGEAVLERISNNIQLKAIRLLVGQSGRRAWVYVCTLATRPHSTAQVNGLARAQGTGFQWFTNSFSCRNLNLWIQNLESSHTVAGRASQTTTLFGSIQLLSVVPKTVSDFLCTCVC